MRTFMIKSQKKEEKMKTIKRIRLKDVLVGVIILLTILGFMGSTSIAQTEKIHAEAHSRLHSWSLPISIPP